LKISRGVKIVFFFLWMHDHDTEDVFPLHSKAYHQTSDSRTVALQKLTLTPFVKVIPVCDCVCNKTCIFALLQIRRLTVLLGLLFRLRYLLFS